MNDWQLEVKLSFNESGFHSLCFLSLHILSAGWFLALWSVILQQLPFCFLHVGCSINTETGVLPEVLPMLGSILSPLRVGSPLWVSPSCFPSYHFSLLIPLHWVWRHLTVMAEVSSVLPFRIGKLIYKFHTQWHGITVAKGREQYLKSTKNCSFFTQFLFCPT